MKESQKNVMKAEIISNVRKILEYASMDQNISDEEMTLLSVFQVTFLERNEGPQNGLYLRHKLETWSESA